MGQLRLNVSQIRDFKLLGSQVKRQRLQPSWGKFDEKATHSRKSRAVSGSVLHEKGRDDYQPAYNVA